VKVGAKAAESKSNAAPPARFLRFSRPDAYREVLQAHLPWALGAGILLFVSILLPYRDVPFRVCAFLRWTGYSCPFCGFSRGFSAITHGAWREALVTCPLSCLLYALVAGVFTWSMADLLFGLRIERGALVEGRAARGWLVLLLVLLVANWAYVIRYVG